MKVKQSIHCSQSKVAQTKAASQNIQIRMNIVKYISMGVQLCPVSGLRQQHHWSLHSKVHKHGCTVVSSVWSTATASLVGPHGHDTEVFVAKSKALTMRCHPNVTGKYIRAGKCRRAIKS